MVRRFSFQLNRRLSALTRRRVGLSLQDGELWASGMLRPAGFSAGRGACARGGYSARRCFALTRRNDIPLYRIVNCAAARRLCLPDIVPAQGYRARGGCAAGRCSAIGLSCVRFVPGVRSYRNVSRSVRAGRAFLSECPAFDHACCLPHSAKQDGLRFCRTFCLRSRRGLRFWRGGLPSFTPGLAVLLRCFAVGSRLSFFLCQEKRDGLRYAPFLFCRVEIAFVRSRSVGAVICLCGFTSGLCVSLWRSRRVTGVRRTGIRGRRCGLCAFLRRRIGLGVFPRGIRWGFAPQTAPKSLRLSGLSSGAGRVRKCVSRGGAVLVRIRAAVIRVHGKTRRTPIYGSAGRAV